MEDYDKIFADMNSKINDKKYEKIIIDVSHGFRHLPILATKFYNKKYFLPVLALLFEGVRSYAVLKMSKNDKVLKIIKNLRENSKKKDDYQIRDMCMKALSPTSNLKSQHHK
nr:TM1812 family CRISPR-associated protein [Campylobacter sp.]